MLFCGKFVICGSRRNVWRVLPRGFAVFGLVSSVSAVDPEHERGRDYSSRRRRRRESESESERESAVDAVSACGAEGVFFRSLEFWGRCFRILALPQRDLSASTETRLRVQGFGLRV